MFNLSKIIYQPSILGVNGTLSSINQVNWGTSDSSTTWEPPKELLRSAKCATKQYNKMYKKKNPD